MVRSDTIVNKWDFSGRSVAITGATGGIANAILTAVAPSARRLVLHARDEAAVHSLAEQLAEHGVKIDIVIGDLADESEQVADALANGEPIDVLINNAGVYTSGDLVSTPLHVIRRDLMINAFAAVASMKAVLPDMNQRGFGRIVNVSLGYGSFGEGLSPAHAAYSISKVAMNAATVMASTAARGDVKVNAMCPGWVRTKMGGAGAPRSPEQGADTALWLATLARDGPNGGFFRDRKEIPW